MCRSRPLTKSGSGPSWKWEVSARRSAQQELAAHADQEEEHVEDALDLRFALRGHGFHGPPEWR